MQAVQDLLARTLGGLLVPFMIVFAAIAFLLAVRFVASRYKKIPPNRVGIFYGMKYTHVSAAGQKQTLGFKVVSGGGRVLRPFVESYQEMSTAAFQVPIDEEGIPNQDNVKVNVKGVATCKISTVPEELHQAVQAFLGKDDKEINGFIGNILKGHLRSIIGKLDIDKLLRERDEFNKNVLDESSNELRNLGVDIVTLVIQEVGDEYGYIDALGKRAVAEAKRDAEIKVAEADKETQIKVSDAKREAAMVQAQNDAKIAEAEKDRDVKKASFKAESDKEVAKANQAGPLAKAESQKDVVRAEVQVDKTKAEAEIELQEAIGKRKEAELRATVLKEAEAEKQRTITVAEGQAAARKTTAAAEQTALEAEGEGQAKKQRAIGMAQAEVKQKQGEAEAAANRAQMEGTAAGTRAGLMAQAEGTRAQLEAQAAGSRAELMAQAEGFQKLLESYRDLTPQQQEMLKLKWLLEAMPGMIDKLGVAGEKIMSQIAQSVTASLGQIDNITVYDSSSNGDGGIHRVAKIVPDILFEVSQALKATGMIPVLKTAFSKLGLDLDALTPGHDGTPPTSGNDKSKAAGAS
jgi:flotillin